MEGNLAIVPSDPAIKNSFFRVRFPRLTTRTSLDLELIGAIQTGEPASISREMRDARLGSSLTCSQTKYCRQHFGTELYLSSQPWSQNLRSSLLTLCTSSFIKNIQSWQPEAELRLKYRAYVDIYLYFVFKLQKNIKK